MALLSDEVFEGDDGHLFLVGGSNDVSRLFLESNENLDSICAAWKTRLLTRKTVAISKRIKYLHCFIPDKISVLREKAIEIASVMHFPAEIIERDRGSELLNTVVPLTDYLRKQKNKYEIFHKTDTHWTIEGCFSAYQMLCAYIGIPQNTSLIMRNSSPLEGTWDLGSKLNPKRLEAIKFGRFGIGALRTVANEIVTSREEGKLRNNLMLHVGSIVEYHNTNKDVAKLRVLVFGDSFFEYRPHMLTGMFAETVETIMFVWSSAIDWSLVDEFEPNVVITEIAERFMRVVPDDNVDIRSHAKKKLEDALKANQ